MNRVFAIVLLVCVANGGEASKRGQKLRAEFEAKLPINFDGLGDYLSKKVASADSEANLEAIKANIGSLRGGVERAAQIVLTIEKAQQCDDQLLALLKEAQSYGLTPYGKGRVTLAIRPHLDRVLELCTDHMEYNVKKTYNQLIGNNETMSKFVDVFSADNVVWPLRAVKAKGTIPIEFYDVLLGNRKIAVSLTELGAFMVQLAKEDPLTIVKKVDQREWQKLVPVTLYTIDKDNIQYAFQKYLKEPCQLLSSNVSKFFDAAIILVDIRDRYFQFMTERSPQFKSIAWRNNACNFVLSLDEQQVASMPRPVWSEKA